MASILQVNEIKDSGGNNTGITVADSSANVTINNHITMGIKFFHTVFFRLLEIGLMSEISWYLCYTKAQLQILIRVVQNCCILGKIRF